LATANITRQENGHQVQLQSSYKYDEDGLRVSDTTTQTIDNGTPTTSTNLYLIDKENPTGFAQTLETRPASGAAPSTTYVLGIDIISQRQAGSDLILLPDVLDSTRILTDINAAITNRYDFDAYGNLLNAVLGVLSPPATRVLYAGQMFDPTLLQYSMRARLYDPTTGRFTQRDSFPGVLSVPLSLHKYIYTHDNPENLRDPSGYESLVELMVVLYIGALITAHSLAAYFKGREATKEGFQQIFIEDMWLILVGGLLQLNLWGVWPLAAVYDIYNIEKFQLRPYSSLRNVEGNVTTLNGIHTGALNNVIDMLRLGVGASLFGFPDFSSIALNRYSVWGRFLLKGKSLIINSPYLGNRRSDSVEADFVSFLGPGIRDRTATEWHHHEILGIFILTPNYLNNPAFGGIHHVGGAWFYKVANNLDVYGFSKSEEEND
jgi:RHS repeat-associated protein